MRRRATILLALGVLAAAAPADAQSRRTTLTVSVRVVRAPAPAVSTAEATQVSTSPGLAPPNQAAPGQPAPIARTEEAGVPQPGLLRATTEPGSDPAPVAELPGFRTVTINY